MRVSKTQLWVALAAIALVMIATPASHAQLNSGASTVALNATLGESLTIAVSPASVSFALAPSGTSNGNSPVSITTTWVLASTRTSVGLYAYFTSATALTDGLGHNIPTTNFNGSINGGGYASFTGGTGPFGANSVTIFNLSPVGTFNSSRSDTLGLQINTTGLSLPAGTYTGTLDVQAQAI